MTLMIPVSWGELIDKITILEIKSKRITDPLKVENVRHELELLRGVMDEQGKSGGELSSLEGQLLAVNTQLWEIEDEIRLCEKNEEFGERFIELARAVYVTNDRRAALKYEVNSLLDSDVIEEKSYQHYNSE